MRASVIYSKLALETLSVGILERGSDAMVAVPIHTIDQQSRLQSAEEIIYKSISSECGARSGKRTLCDTVILPSIPVHLVLSQFFSLVFVLVAAT